MKKNLFWNITKKKYKVYESTENEWSEYLKMW